MNPIEAHLQPSSPSVRPLGSRPISCRFLRFFIAGLSLLMLGCGDDGTVPPPPHDTPTIDNIWPNEDTRYWQFDLRSSEWANSDSVYMNANCDSVPPAPGFPEVIRRMALHPDSLQSRTGRYRLQFAGMDTTESGMIGQRLRGDTLAPVPGKASGSAGEAFLRRLYLARPDLRAAIQRSYPAMAASVNAVDLDAGIMLSGGGAWIKTADYIGGYGELDTLLSWKYLERDLTPGHEFTMQLVPSLADDVFLHLRVDQMKSWTAPAGTIANSLECLYLIDYGLSQYMDESGHSLGCFRGLTYGRIVYAPNVGPVYDFERNELAPIPIAFPSLEFNAFDSELQLRSFGIPAVQPAARPGGQIIGVTAKSN